MADLIASAQKGGTASNGGAELEAAFLDPEEQEQLVEHAISWATAHGVNIRLSPGEASHAPFSLLPVEYPQQAFLEAVELSTTFSTLVDRVSRDISWISSVLQPVIGHDEFTRKLLEIAEAVEREGLAQTAYLGIHRSDYMLHETEGASHAAQLQQVELNTIASSFGALSTQITKMHRFLLERFSKEMPSIGQFYGLEGKIGVAQKLPDNPTLREISKVMAEVHKFYGVSSAIILFVVQPNEVNSVDQRWLEYTLWEERGKIEVARRTLREIYEQATLEGPERRLMLNGREVALAYFRAGYTPNDYPGEKEWEARKLLERSRAIKCPSVVYQLVGAKKIQQALASPNQLERFLSETESKRVRRCFAGLWGLSKQDEGVDKIIDEALKDPSKFVMKPQREGGGNNYYGEELAEMLKNLDEEERGTYILMSKITPAKNRAVLVRAGKALSGWSISELGTYGVALFEGRAGQGVEVFNRHAGHLLRTKLQGVNEGGVATGFAVLSSPFLI